MAVSALPPSGSARSAVPSRSGAPGKRFCDALRRAEGPGGAAQPRSLRSTHRPVPIGARAPEDRRPAPGGAGAPPEARLTSSAPPGIPELQAAVRAAPPVIAAALAQGGQPQLALNFGPALTVDLRAGAEGLTLSLRPGPTLDRAARAELPRLVEALRARGLRVARAEVHGPGSVGAAQAPSRAR